MAGKRRVNQPTLARADMNLKLDRGAYDGKLEKLQRKLTQVQQAYLYQQRSSVMVFEGWDAAGKGGTIRRISAALDPRSFKVWPIGPPRKYYLDRRHLLPFVERLPPAGAITAFDRSWYGRVLVERVEGLAPKTRWKAAYREINDFERTSTSYAPWHLIPANDKKYARIAAISRIVECFAHKVDLPPPALHDIVISEALQLMDLEPSLVESLSGRTD